jgi:hypothetical protein
MTIPTEPIGSIPRPPALIESVATRDGVDPSLESVYEETIRDACGFSRHNVLVDPPLSEVLAG